MARRVALALVWETHHKFSGIFIFQFVVLSLVGTCLSFMPKFFNQHAVCLEWMLSRCVDLPSLTSFKMSHSVMWDGCDLNHTPHSLSHEALWHKWMFKRFMSRWMADSDHTHCVDFAVLHYNKGTKKLHDWSSINIALPSAGFKCDFCQCRNGTVCL